MSAEGEIKQVTVSLSHPDELNPRRRRRTRKFKDDVDSQSAGATLESSPTSTNNTSTAAVVVQKEIPTTTVSSVPNTEPVQSTNPIQNVASASTQPAPVLAAVTMVGGNPGGIQIRDKKNKSPLSNTGIPTPALSELNAPNAPNAPPATAIPRIIPHKKRLIGAPLAQTLKKPKFVIPTGTAAPAPVPNSPLQNSSPAPPLPTSTRENPIRKTVRGVGGEEDTNLKPVGGGSTTRRRFTERRIKIEVKPIVKTRKNRKVLKEHIDKMPIQTVRRILIKKGLLKAKTTVPPESMLRSMLHDYYLLKQNE